MMKKILAVALACSSMVATTGAWADGHGHGHGGGHWGGHGHYSHGHYGHGGPGWHGGPRYIHGGPPRAFYGPPRGGGVVDGRLPGYYPGAYYVVDDWRARHLYAPRPGYHWVRSGADYLLVGIATGLIAGTILAQ